MLRRSVVATIITCCAAACAGARVGDVVPTEHAFVFLRPAAVALNEEEARRLGRGHMANIRRLAAEGVLVFAGPTGDGGGVFILRTGSLSQAQEILSSDPAVAGGALQPDTFLVNIAHGALCAAPEPISMMGRDLVAGRFGDVGEARDLIRELGLAPADLVAVDPVNDRFVIIWDGEASPERRARASATALALGVSLSEVGQVYSPRGALCRAET